MHYFTAEYYFSAGFLGRIKTLTTCLEWRKIEKFWSGVVACAVDVRDYE